VSRYFGRDLPANPSIAVIANDAIGNFVVVTPLLQMLRQNLRPSSIHFYSGPRTREFQERSDLFEGCYEFLGQPCGALLTGVRNRYDLVVNVEKSPMAMVLATVLAEGKGQVCGPAANPDGRGEMPFPDDLEGRLWQDPEWTSPSIAERYPILQSSFIGEIFCRICYLKGPVPPYRVPTEVPDRDAPDILISTAASLPDKLWTVANWVSLLKALEGEGLTAGLLGAKPSSQAKHWMGSGEEEQILNQTNLVDLRGTLTLPQVAGLMSKCRMIVTVDNGIMHLAAASGKPTVALFRNGIQRLWLPPIGSVTAVTPGPEQPVASIELTTVLEAVRRVIHSDENHA